MPIFACPKCSQHLSVPDSAAGQTVACPRCGQALAIPAAAPAPVQRVAAGAPQAPSQPAMSSHAVRHGLPGQAPPTSADGAAPAASIRLPTAVLTRLPKPILFALFGALGALIGAILVELPFYLAKPAAAPAPTKTVADVDIMFFLDVTG